jgi:hypothetical protein
VCDVRRLRWVRGEMMGAEVGGGAGEDEPNDAPGKGKNDEAGVMGMVRGLANAGNAGGSAGRACIVRGGVRCAGVAARDRDIVEG